MHSPRRLRRSARHEREHALLLGAAAALCVLTSLWLLAVGGTWPRLFALAGLGFGWLFALRARRAWGAAAAAPDSFLELAAAGLRVCDGGQGQLLPWSQIRAVDVDEERLVVALVGQDGRKLLEIEPCYGDLGVHDLRDTLTAAWQAAQPDDGCNAHKRG
jgi:hypothetical protein